MIMNSDSIIDIASKWTFSTLSELKHLMHYSAIKNIFFILSKLKHLFFSVLDSLCPNKAKLCHLNLITFVYNFNSNLINL